MQDTVKTAGETALPYNRFEREIIDINRRRDERIQEVWDRQQPLIDERDALKLQRQEHHMAIEAANRRIAEITAAIKAMEAEKDGYRAEAKARKAQVVEEANEHYEKFPVENWLWKKVYRFFKKNPDVCLQIMKEEGGEQ